LLDDSPQFFTMGQKPKKISIVSMGTFSIFMLILRSANEDHGNHWHICHINANVHISFGDPPLIVYRMAK